MKKKVYVLVTIQKSDNFQSYPEVETFAEYQPAMEAFLIKVNDSISNWVSEYGIDNVKACHSESGNSSVVNYIIENPEDTTEPHFDIFDVRDCVLKSESIFIRETEIELEDKTPATAETKAVKKSKQHTKTPKTKETGVVIEEVEEKKPRKTKKKAVTE